MLAAPLAADEALDDRMMHAASILQEIRGPLEQEAPKVLQDTYALAVFPEFVKVGLLGGVKHGRGVLATRLESGNWSKPAFVRITSGSLGLQLGVSMSQLVIAFKDPKAVEAISGGQFTIGADAGYAAGQLGGSATAGTDNKLENRIVMMARSKGLFAGVALEGGVLRVEKDSNVAFYDDAIGLDGRTLLDDEEVELPPVAQHFLIVLGESVPPVSPEAAPTDGERESNVNLRFAEDESAETIAGSAAGQAAADGVGAGAAPGAASWVTPANGNAAPNYGQSSEPGLAGRIIGKVTDAALDSAKDRAVDSVRDTPEVRGAKLAARVGEKLVSSAKPGPAAPAPRTSPPAPRTRALPEPERAIASSDGAWIAPDAPEYRMASRSPAPPPIAAASGAEFAGPPAPSEWPAEWRDAQLLGGVCQPGS